MDRLEQKTPGVTYEVTGMHVTGRDERAHMGAVLFIGVGVAFVMTVLIVPVLIKEKAA